MIIFMLNYVFKQTTKGKKMNKEKAKRLFKKHYNYAMKLKEGGKAWEREMNRCEQYKNVVMGEQNE